MLLLWPSYVATPGEEKAILDAMIKGSIDKEQRLAIILMLPTILEPPRLEHFVSGLNISWFKCYIFFKKE